MGKNDLKIKLEPKDTDIIKIKATDKAIRLQLSLKNTPYNKVIWNVTCSYVNRVYQGGETILVSIPSSLSGNDILVNATYYGVKEEGKSSSNKISTFKHDTISDLFKENKLNRKFQTQQEVSLQNLIWKNRNNVSFSLYPLIFRADAKSGSLVIYGTGLNSKRINYKFSFNGVKEKTESFVICQNNRGFFQFQIPDKYLEKGIKKVTIALHLTSNNDWEIKNVFNKCKFLLSKEIILNDYMLDLDKDKAIAEIEPVLVEGISINDNNFKPCKFTKVQLVTVSEEPGVLNTLFKDVKQYMGETFEIESLKEPPQEEETEN